MIRLSPREQGFTLIELLIVVAIIGILAAIAIPNLLTAMQRSKQKRTMADIRSAATAWEARAIDTNTYAAAGDTFIMPAEVSFSELSASLSPTYIRSMPENDGWNVAYGYGANRNEYGIRSCGKDGVLESRYASGPTTNFDCDIVYSNGSFVAWPEGMQNSGGESATPPPAETPPPSDPRV